jgi:hypothetical protein
MRTKYVGAESNKRDKRRKGKLREKRRWARREGGLIW